MNILNKIILFLIVINLLYAYDYIIPVTFQHNGEVLTIINRNNFDVIVKYIVDNDIYESIVKSQTGNYSYGIYSINIGKNKTVKYISTRKYKNYDIKNFIQ
ncbi:hypothetical protein [Brachyspira innocens]|uniref:hypothetical protein n=1 Tax=Brachyspira innocens TaxID=13264 RepID=UPI0026EBE566|nr:hypothetical protein [Brachyspira innocens]